MPRAPKVCNAKGCSAPAHGDPRCETHRAELQRTAWAKADSSRPNANARGYDRTWRRFRVQYLQAHPTCVQCGTAATDVDHIDGGGPLAPNGYDERNLQALCHRCHSLKTTKHDGAFGRGPHA